MGEGGPRLKLIDKAHFLDYRKGGNVQLTIREDPPGRNLNAVQHANVVKDGTPVAVALGVVDKGANVDRLRRVANARTDGDRDVIWKEFKMFSL